MTTTYSGVKFGISCPQSQPTCINFSEFISPG